MVHITRKGLKWRVVQKMELFVPGWRFRFRDPSLDSTEAHLSLSHSRERRVCVCVCGKGQIKGRMRGASGGEVLVHVG